MRLLTTCSLFRLLKKASLVTIGLLFSITMLIAQELVMNNKI